MGSITHVLAEAGADAGGKRVLNRYGYDAFGNVLECEETVHNRFLYTGQQYDSVTAQYYLRARFYNPVIGRFTQEDSYYGDGPNLFEYCHGNPLMYYDPSGHKAKAICPAKYDSYVQRQKNGETLTDAELAEMKRYERGKDNPYYQAERSGVSSKEAYNILNKDKTSFSTKEDFNNYYYNELLKVAKSMYATPENAMLIGSTKTWNEFIAANPSSDMNSSASKYIDMIINESPWPNGYNSSSNILTLHEGDKFNMVLDLNQPLNQPGGFGIIDDVSGIDFARNDMAIKSNWKNDCGKLVTYQIKSGQEINVLAGPIGPQIDLWADTYLPGNDNLIQLDLFAEFNGTSIDKNIYIEVLAGSVRFLN